MESSTTETPYWGVVLYEFRTPATAKFAVAFIDDLLGRWDLPIGRTTVRWAGSDKSLHTRWSKLRQTLLASSSEIVVPFKSAGIELAHDRADEKKSPPYEVGFSNDFSKFTLGLPSSMATAEDIIDIARSVAHQVRPLYGFATAIRASQSALF